MKRLLFAVLMAAPLSAFAGDNDWNPSKDLTRVLPEFKELLTRNVNIGSLKGLAEGNTPHTIAAWIKVTKVPTVPSRSFHNKRAWILQLGSGLGAHLWLIYEDGRTDFAPWNGAKAVTTKLDVGVWKHVAMTFNGSKLKGYVDGAEVGTAKVNFNLLGIPLTLNKPSLGEANFEGQLDDVRIYDRALSEKDVAELAKPIAETPAELKDGLILWWKFDDGKGAVATDSCGNGNNGTLDNEPAWVEGKINGAISFEDGKDSGRKNLTISGRRLEIFQHGVRKEWGYKAPQVNTFIVVHPKKERKNAALYVVLHSSGHNVVSCMDCTAVVGNHDIYRSPDEFYALYLDSQGDSWWGGAAPNDPNSIKRHASGDDPSPVERRVIDTVKWVIRKYNIDADRVYLCGVSMGGSGTLGIGMHNGDVFAAIKANVPAGIEHVSQRMYFPPQSLPENVKLPDPPVAVDYSATNDGWSAGHERFVKAMSDRKYALLFYGGPFGHEASSAKIMKVNDLINSFDWLNVKKNEAYPVFTKASTDNKIPWPDRLRESAPGQINAFFRWKNVADTEKKLEMSLFLTTAAELKTTFQIPGESTGDVSLRRIQNLQVKPGEALKWKFGSAKGEVKADADGCITIPGLKIVAEPTSLTVSR